MACRNKKDKWLTREVWHLYPAFEDAAPGVYVIYVGGIPSYVGTSENIKARIRQHRLLNCADGTTKTPWGSFCFVTNPVTFKVKYPKRYGAHLMLEARLIRRLRPQFNIRGVR